MTCREAVGLVSDYLDGSLALDARRRFEKHLAECEHCTEYVKQIQVAVAASGQVRAEDLDPLAREALLDLYRRWRDDQPDR
jgi:anti-sigma factor RsiW